jgi:L-ribulose-5-phosphate 4-epimerase
MDTRVNDQAEIYLRRQVAACTRILNGEDILGYSGHVSARLPDRPDVILIQSFDQSRAEVAPDDLLVVGLDGDVHSAPEGVSPPDEVSIHLEILRARPDVNSVLHFHPDLPVLFTLVEGAELRPIMNHAYRWASGIPVHPDASKIVKPAQARALAETLGESHAALMRAHGAVVLSESVPALLVDAVHFVENADALYRASLLGKPKFLSEDEMVEVAKKQGRPRHIDKLWSYYVNKALVAGTLPEAWGAGL